MAKTFDTIINEMVAYVESQLGQQDTRVGTVLREAFLAPVGNQLEAAYARTDEVELNQSIASAESISSEAMERLAANFGLARFPGTPSSGTVRFSRFQQPTTTISIPSGTIVSTSDTGDSFGFSTQLAATITSSSPQDPVTGAYYVDVTVIASINGSAGNVDADTVRFHSVAGVDEVTNPNALSGGKDEQTNTELAELIIARAQGNLGTRSGYEDAIRSNFSIDDMEIVTPADSDATRAQFGGELDITILSETLVESQETTANSTTVFYPTFLPIVEVVEIIGIENGTDNEITLVPGTDYDVVVDTYSPLSRSTSEKSRVNLHVISFTVKPASVFTIRYTNSQIIRVIQGYLDDETNAILGADVLVKLAVDVPVDITAEIRIIPGYDADTVKADVETAVQDHFNAQLLGDDVQISDVVTVVGNVAGVDSVDLNTFQMARSDDPFNYLQEISASKLEYLRPGTISVTVVG